MRSSRVPEPPQPVNGRVAATLDWAMGEGETMGIIIDDRSRAIISTTY